MCYVVFGDSIINGFGDFVDGDEVGYLDWFECLFVDGLMVIKFGFDG